MKKFYVLLSILIVGIFFITGCGNKNNSPESNIKKEVTNNVIMNASPQLTTNLQSILNNNWTIIDTNKIYVTKSKDFENAYFIGTLVKNGSQIYNCIWFSNNADLNGMTMSANDFAIQASSMPDGRKSQAAISETDDGYSRINQKLLTDWESLK